MEKDILMKKITFLQPDLKDKQAILSLYRSMIGTKGCTWSMDYPNEEILENDFKRQAIFVIRNEKNEIIGTISIDDDSEVDQLECWSDSLKPAAELARLAIKDDYQNLGLARFMLQSVMEELKKRNYKSVHFLVSKTNVRALRSYAKLNFERKGESDLFGENWWCYEKELVR